MGLYDTGDSASGGSVGPGRRLGRYELVSVIGEGGMGRVWAARMEGVHGFRKVVAVKTLSPAVAADPEAERMLLNEAHLAAQIRHRNVVEILDLGEQDGVAYIVMEHIDGESLQRLLRPSGRPVALEPAIAARIAADAAAGLHAAHELHDDKGRPIAIVHRDVSPQNILIGRDGTVKVVDFGIAKALGNVHEATRSGDLKGKLAYMSPEQVNARPVDRRSDIFALGVVLFEMLTGSRPFVAEHEIAVLQLIARGQAPRPTSINAQIPPELEQIVMTALASDVAARFPTAEQFSMALEHFLARSGQVVTAATLAALVRERAGARLEASRQRIREPALGASEPPPGRSGAGRPAETPVLTPSSDLSSTLLRRASVAPTGTTRVGALTRAAPWMVAAGAIAVASMAVFVLRASFGSGSPSDHPTPVHRTSAIAVRVNPPAARVMVGGALAGAGDQLVARPPAGAHTEVLVALDGYTTATVDLTIDGPDEIHVELTRAPTAPGREPAPSATEERPPPAPPVRPRPRDVERPPGAGTVSVPKNPY